MANPPLYPIPTGTQIPLNTPWQVICDAFFEAGKTGLGEVPSGEELAYGMRRLNNLMNLRQAQGLRLWLQFDLAVTLVALQNLYTMGSTGSIIMARPTRIIEGYYQDINLVNRPLLVLSRNEWDTLSTFGTNSPGSVNSYFVDKQINTMNIYFWLTPDAQAATGKAHIIIQQQQPNVVGLTDQLIFGPEWFLYLVWELAYEFSQGQPLAVQQRCQAMADKYREIVDGWDVEDASTFFQTDQRMSYQSGKFV